MAIDLLELEGVDRTAVTWSERRAELEALLDDRVDEVRLSRAFDDGRALRELARAQGLGIVAKRRDGRYREGVEERRLAALPALTAPGFRDPRPRQNRPLSTTRERSMSAEKVAELAKGIRVAMLTTIDDAGHYVSRPMAQQQVEFDGDLWFFAERHSRKVASDHRPPGGRRDADLRATRGFRSRASPSSWTTARRCTNSGTAGSPRGSRRAPTIRASCC